MSVGYSGVVNFANTYPGTAIRTVANANNGWGNDVGGSEVICEFGVLPLNFFIELEDDSGYILMESTGGILLEA